MIKTNGDIKRLIQIELELDEARGHLASAAALSESFRGGLLEAINRVYAEALKANDLIVETRAEIGERVREMERAK